VKESQKDGLGLPKVALCMGDPAGIGPEIVAKVLLDGDVYRQCIPVVIGDAGSLSRAPGWQSSGLRLQRVQAADVGAVQPGTVAIVDMDNVPDGLRVGVPSPEGGKAVTEYLNKAMELALAGQVDVVVSAPLNKESIKLAGYDFDDECDYLASLLGVEEYTVLVVGRRFTLATVALHVAIKDVAGWITRDRVLRTLRDSHSAISREGTVRPRIGVAALNPHGGEGGTLGTEEVEAIRPAIDRARAEGIDVHGPFPADSFFATLRDPIYDVYVGMYHDQGRAAMKLLDFGHATTTIEGLPVPYYTPAHGSAYDIAGKGVAEHQNMKEALLLAVRRVSHQ